MALMYETIAMEKGEVGLIRVIQEVEAMSSGRVVFTIGQVGMLIHLIEETTSMVEMPLGMTLKS